MGAVRLSRFDHLARTIAGERITDGASISVTRYDRTESYMDGGQVARRLVSSKIVWKLAGRGHMVQFTGGRLHRADAEMEAAATLFAAAVGDTIKPGTFTDSKAS
jgi:hypothetical protein